MKALKYLIIATFASSLLLGSAFAAVEGGSSSKGSGHSGMTKPSTKKPSAGKKSMKKAMKKASKKGGVSGQ